MSTQAPTDSRERILARIREALQSPAPKRHLNPPAGLPTHQLEPGGVGHTPQEWLPQVPASIEDRIALFESNSTELKTRVIRCTGEDALVEALKCLATEQGWRRVASHQFPLGHTAILSAGLPVTWVDEGYQVADMESADAGITGCECLVTQTGSILVTAASSGGRTLSVLPPHHVVIAHRSQVVADLSEALAVAKASHQGKQPAFLSFITGPSRTGDIEHTLVLGAHGPKQLTVILVD